MIRWRTREGVALATTMYFLALLGLLVIGTLYTARGAGSAGELSIEDAELTAASERVLAEVVASWSSGERAAQPIATTVNIALPQTWRLAQSASITRLEPRLFWVVADVQRPSGSSRRRIALTVRLANEGPDVSAALLARGNVHLGGGAAVLSAASSLGDCSIDDTTGVAIEVGTGATVYVDQSTTSVPTWVASDRATDDAPYRELGTQSWDQLRADLELPADSALALRPSAFGSCGVARAPDDWGDPFAVNGACASWAPIVHARGNLTLHGGRGQGILLVDGRLRVTGALRFRGLIVSRGGVEILADDVEISGAVLSDTPRSVGGVTDSSVVIRARATLRASRCDVVRVFAAHSAVRRVRERAWMEMW